MHSCARQQLFLCCRCSQPDRDSGSTKAGGRRRLILTASTASTTITTAGAIDEDGDLGRNEIAAAAKHLGVTYPILMPDHTVSKKYGGVDYLPETFYVDRNGTIVAQAAGARTKDQIEMSILAALRSGT